MRRSIGGTNAHDRLQHALDSGDFQGASRIAGEGPGADDSCAAFELHPTTHLQESISALREDAAESTTESCMRRWSVLADGAVALSVLACARRQWWPVAAK